MGDCEQITKFFYLTDNKEFLEKSLFPRGIVLLEEEFQDGSELLVTLIECLDKIINLHLPYEYLVHIKYMVMNQVGLRNDGSQRCWFSLKYDSTPRLSFDESNKILQEYNEDYKTKILLGS